MLDHEVPCPYGLAHQMVGVGVRVKVRVRPQFLWDDGMQPLAKGDSLKPARAHQGEGLEVDP